MKNARPLLAIASTLLAAFALTPSAQADEPAPAPDSSEAPAAEAPAAEAPAADAPTSESLKVASPPTSAPRVDVVAPPPLAPTRASSVTTPPVRVVEQGPRSPGLGIAGIVTTVLGGGAMATGFGLAAAEEDGAAPTLLVGSLLSLTGLVLAGVGYSSPSAGPETGARAKRSARVAPAPDEPSWEEKQASRESHRDLGIGLTVSGVMLAGAGAALLGVGAAQEASYVPGLRFVPGVGVITVASTLLGVGIPLWAENSGEEPRPLVQAELGIGPGSIELRGSF